jgi:hypothetical protein
MLHMLRTRYQSLTFAGAKIRLFRVQLQHLAGKNPVIQQRNYENLLTDNVDSLWRLGGLRIIGVTEWGNIGLSSFRIEFGEAARLTA